MFRNYKEKRPEEVYKGNVENIVLEVVDCDMKPRR